MSEWDNLDGLDLDAAEATVQQQQAEEQSQPAPEVDNSCEGGACTI